MFPSGLLLNHDNPLVSIYPIQACCNIVSNLFLDYFKPVSFKQPDKLTEFHFRTPMLSPNTIHQQWRQRVCRSSAAALLAIC